MYILCIYLVKCCVIYLIYVVGKFFHCYQLEFAYVQILVKYYSSLAGKTFFTF